jgi:hypothetical protein
MVLKVGGHPGNGELLHAGTHLFLAPIFRSYRGGNPYVTREDYSVRIHEYITYGLGIH